MFLTWFFRILLLGAGFWGLFRITNLISYSILKHKTLQERRWDLNICCGVTDGGGVNADIVQHGEAPNFVKVDSIYRLPFDDNQFDTVLCSHTMEHVEDPDRFYQELKRVGREIRLVLPPLWDITAVLNFFEHRWVFLTLKKDHSMLPPRVHLPFARTYQSANGQTIHC